MEVTGRKGEVVKPEQFLWDNEHRRTNKFGCVKLCKLKTRQVRLVLHTNLSLKNILCV